MWELQYHILSALVLLASLVASLHALFQKREVSAAIGWIALIWFVPLGGAILYGLLGINRIRRSAQRLPLVHGEFAGQSPLTTSVQQLRERLPGHPGLDGLHRLGDNVLGAPLLLGHQLEIYGDSTAAYDAMLEAISQATESVTLCSYIFAYDGIGRRFADALEAAQERGAQVRVLVDAYGLRFARAGNVVSELNARGVAAARFLPTLAPRWMPFVNLRNHRKLLITDGRWAFIGGLNIWDKYSSLGDEPPNVDAHFRVAGPVVGQLQSVFAEDWLFAASERLTGTCYFPALEPLEGEVLAARAVPDGPDEDFEALRNLLLGALNMATERIRIVSPYFLPDPGLVDAMATASRRGVEVEIYLPSKTNVWMVERAMRAQLWQVLEPGCKVLLTPPPFDHAKLLTVDGVWSLIGSANLDPRSIRLNFELNVELYGEEVTGRIDQEIDKRLEVATKLTLEEYNSRRFSQRLVDAIVRLWTPYL